MELHVPEPLAGLSNLSRKVIAVAAGESHTLALSGNGCVYSWGRGMFGPFGRLGNGSEADEVLPVQVDFGFAEEKKVKFVGVAAGAYHSLALADDGSVWCWGYNILDGQLGFNGENCLVPRLMDSFSELSSPGSKTQESGQKNESPLKVHLVRAGGLMSLAVDSLGGLWMWGNCPQQDSAGTGFSMTSSPFPVPVWDFHGHTVVKVACGNEHVIALVSAGETYKGEDLVCYSWGNNKHGQLGLGDKESRARPEIIQTFNEDSSLSVYEAACGAFHTALLTHKRSPNGDLESTCWTFGRGDNGQLGLGTTQSSSRPEPVKSLPRYTYLTSVDCGLIHTSVVSSGGDVWSWGMAKGLGLCPEASFTTTHAGDAVLPVSIPCNGPNGPKFRDPLQVACGAAHTVVVSDNGFKLWSWGRGRSGVLGNGQTVDCFAPTMVLWPPLEEDFKDLNTSAEEDKKDGETDTKLRSAMEEIELLKSKLLAMERYASILHGSVFGKPFEESDVPPLLRSSGSFDIGREWENMLEAADRGKLLRLEMFYRNMVAGVKDKLMKKRIEELVKECLGSSNQGR